MPGGHDKKLSFYAQKALGRYRDRLGFGTEVDFHSCRRNFASTMEALAAYPPALTRWMGHKPPGITLGLYAKGEAPALMQIAKAIRYPGKIETAFRKALDV